MATTEKQKPPLDMTGGETYVRANHKPLWEYFGWVERLLPAYALGLQRALCVLRHPGTTRHERARAAADAISAIVAVRAALDTKPNTDPAAATLRDFDPTACACVRQLAQELTEYAVPAMLAPSEQEAADMRLALLLSADMPPLFSDGQSLNPQDAPPALESLLPVGRSDPITRTTELQNLKNFQRGQSPQLFEPQNEKPAARGDCGGRHWLAALANDLLDEHGDSEDGLSENEEGEDDGKKEIQ